MSPLERDYYEFDRFWNPNSTSLGDKDLRRMEEVAGLIPPEVVSILDAGCGNGMFCHLLQQQRKAGRIIGLDRSKAALKYAQTKRVLGDITELPFAAGAFDCVFSLEVLEHLPIAAFELAVTELARVAAKYIIVSVPNNQLLGENLTQCPACKSRFDPDLHMRSFQVDTMNSLFEDHQFRCQRLEGIGQYTQYVGLNELMSIWYEQRKAKIEMMASPLCPMCGFRNDNYLDGNGALPVEREQSESPNGFLTPAKRVIKRLWPKVTGSQWLVGLYERRS